MTSRCPSLRLFSSVVACLCWTGELWNKYVPGCAFNMPALSGSCCCERTVGAWARSVWLLEVQPARMDAMAAASGFDASLWQGTAALGTATRQILRL